MKATKISLIIFYAATLLFGCTGETKKSEKVSEDGEHKHEMEQDVTRSEAGKPQFSVDEIFQKQVSEVFDSYVRLKEAFVSSDATKVTEEAENTQESLNKVDMKLVTGAAHSDWMSFLKAMQTSLTAIAASDDIEAQRTEFSNLSTALYKTIKAYGLGGKTAYYEFCPMAFDDKGAYWLSDESKIRNPYFGDKMLTCGTVEEKLQ